MLGRSLSRRHAWPNVPCLAILAFAGGCGSGSTAPGTTADAALWDASTDGASDSAASDAADGAAAADAADGAVLDGAPTDASVEAADVAAADAAADAKDAAVYPTEASVDATVDAALDAGDAGAEASSDHDASNAAQDAATGPAPLLITIDGRRGPVRQHNPVGAPQPISSYIYGMNSVDGDLVQSTRWWGLIRKGGHAYTAYNWTSNFGNDGQAACYSQGQYAGGSALAGAFTQGPDSISAAQAKQEPSLITIPLMDHVAAPVVNDTTASCSATTVTCGDGGSRTGTANVKNLDFASANPASTAFVQNLWAKPGGSYCTCAAGQVCDAGCTVSTSPVYQDEFVNFLKVSYGNGGAPIFFSLDDEPNLWGSQHPEVWPNTGGAPPCQDYTVTYDDIVERNEAAARAVKTTWPTAKVFGPVVSQEGMIYAHSDSDPHAPMEFADYYLQRIAADSGSLGQTLIDAFDVHYFNAGTNDPAQCLQNPRMFWDPSYTDISPAAMDALDFGWAGPNQYFDTHWYPRQLIPRLQQKIDNAFAGYGGERPPGLSISAYNNGCETNIAGGLAEVDMLGILGREGVFAAAARPTQPMAGNYLAAAFELYTGGELGSVGRASTSVFASTSDPVNTSAYGFANDRAVVVNRSPLPRPTVLSFLAGFAIPTIVGVCRLTDGDAAVHCVLGGKPLDCDDIGRCTVVDVLPPMSATSYAVLSIN